MKYWLLLALAAVLLFSGCIQQPATLTTTCPSNYMKIGNDCCLDANGNGICDRDEQNASVCPPQTKTLEERMNDCGSDSSCRTLLAIESNNPQVCDGIGRYDDCLEQLAARYNNAAYCQMLPLSYQKEDCLSKLGGNNATCPPASCPSVNVSAPAVNLTCPPANLTLTDRINQCNQISYPQDQDNCLKALAEETNTPSICASLLYSNAPDPSCYEELAIKYKNMGYCDQLTSSWDQTYCKQKVNDSLIK